MKKNTLSVFSRVLCLIAGILIGAAVFQPLWMIDLDAPQYPEGLGLKIYPDKIAGDVDIINGLNHYIGMKTLHTEDFIEFKLLPWLMGSFAFLIALNFLINRKKYLVFSFIALLLFGIVAMIDFWKWEYNYGHDLDPNAAIQVPGMAYQPPLIGFKQLLNFGAYSIPDTGGWMFITSGALILFCVITEFKLYKRKAKSAIAALLVLIGLASCSGPAPKPIQVNKERCAYCEMGISDLRFAAQLVTDKGRTYSFDDVSCMIGYIHENKDQKIHSQWVSSFENPSQLINAETASYIFSEELRSPMGGNLAAFESKEKSEKTHKSTSGELKSWTDIINHE